MNKRQTKKFEKKNKFKTYLGYQLSMEYRYLEKKLQLETDSEFLQNFVHIMFKPFTHEENSTRPTGDGIGFVSSLSVYKSRTGKPDYEKLEVSRLSVDEFRDKLNDALHWLVFNGGGNNEQASEKEV